MTMRRAGKLVLMLATALVGAQSAHGQRDVTRPPGQEQANVFIPIDILEAKGERARRSAMIEYIRSQITARKSSIDMTEVDRVLAAMKRLRREDFVSRAQRRTAYLPVSVDIGDGQTLSDAYVVAVMVAAAKIKPGDRVFDVGTGSGYQAALLSELGGKVTTIEIVPHLAKSARARLTRLGYRDITVVTGDGAVPLPGSQQFDAILVAAGSKAIPDALIRQLKPDGRLILPIGASQFSERLRLVRKGPLGTLESCDLGFAAFVPLTGRSATDRSVSDTSLSLCFAAPVT